MQAFFHGTLFQELLPSMSNLNWNVGISLDGAGAKQQFDKWLDEAVVGGSEEAKRKINKALGGKEEKKFSIQIDSNTGKLATQTKTVLTEWNKIGKAIDYSNKTQKNSLTSLRAQLRTATQLRDSIARYREGVKGSTDEWRRQQAVVRDLNVKVASASGNWAQMLSARVPGGKNIMSLANGLSQVNIAATAVMVGIQAIAGAVKPLVARAKQVQSLTLAFEGMGLTTEQAGQFMSQAKVQALQYGASVTQLEKGYKRIGPAIMQSGGSMADVSDTMASLSARTTTLGLNSEQTGRYIEAFAQVMGKGKLQGEELNQQFSELDGALRGQIKGWLKTNKGITDFEGAMQKGQITSEMFREAFNATSKDMRENLGGSIEEIQSRLDSLNVTQIEQIGATLNTITMESLMETLGPLGMQIQSIILMFQQFFANIATSMPMTQDLVKGLLVVLGALAQFVVVGFLGALKAIFVVFEGIVWIVAKLILGIGKLIEMIPFLGGIFGKIGEGAKNLGNWLAKVTDAWMKVGESAKATEQDLSTLDGRILIFKNSAEAAKMSAEELAAAIAKMKEEAAAAADLKSMQELADKLEEVKNKIKELKAEEAEQKSVYEKEKQDLDVLKEAVKTYYSEIKEAHTARVERTKNYYDTEISNIQKTRDAMKAAHETAMNDLKSRNELAISATEREIEALQAKTPAEEKLAVLRKQEIMDKLKSNDLSEREKLELQAQLERMQRQKQIEEQQLKLKAQKENAAKAEAELAKQQRKEQEEAHKEEKEMREEKKQAMKELKAIGKSIEEQERATMSMFERQAEAINLQGKSIAYINRLVSEQASRVYRAKDAYDATTDAIAAQVAMQERLNRSIDRTNAKMKAQAKKNSKEAPPNTFAGGSVKGGEMRTVNEFGREGFLSLSGRLSEINAPAWGSWKAPSSGTIIPAHIWTQVKTQQSAGGPTRTPMAAGATSGLMAQVSALRGAGSSDIVTNNVTIQSEDVDRTMHQSLISLRRTKRARYY